MFTANQIIKTTVEFAKRFGIPKDTFLLVGSGGLVLTGLKESARDIDVQVDNPETFKFLKDLYPDNYKPKPYAEGHPLYPGVLELLVFETPYGEFEVMLGTLPFVPEEQMTEGIRHLSPEGTKTFKLWMNRTKDIQHLKEAFGY